MHAKAGGYPAGLHSAAQHDKPGSCCVAGATLRSRPPSSDSAPLRNVARDRCRPGQVPPETDAARLPGPAGGPRPAAILAFPVGFVGAAESKQALIEAGCGVPFLTLPGRMGGSAMASAAVNALWAPNEEGAG